MADQPTLGNRRSITTPTLVVLAAGLSSRYGAVKQLDGMGPGGHALMDYSIYDAREAGFEKVVFVIRPELETQFNEHIERMRDRISAQYAFQRLDDTPPGVRVATGRQKPWGTGHAVLAARHLIDGACVVINADDFYGRSAYAALYAHLASHAAPTTTLALVGFALQDTLSPHGGVSRGVCRTDSDGFLIQVSEVVALQREPFGIGGMDLAGNRQLFTGDEIVSTNIWAFTRDIFDRLATRFADFLRTRADAKAEFLIPDAINDILAAGEARAKIMPTDDAFFGVTHPADRADVQQKLQALVASGRYPERLF